MKIKPILFSTPMVRAILEGRKTQTRRIVKFNKEIEVKNIGFSATSPNGSFEVRGIHKNGEYGASFFKLPFKKGDILWVRESFGNTAIGTMYKADINNPQINKPSSGWKPSIHMPKAAARIFLEVTNVRVERLFDISEKDAIAEGIIVIEPEEAYNSYDKGVGSYATARGSFFSLWTSINGQASTDANPWVFVYDFKRVERPANF